MIKGNASGISEGYVSPFAALGPRVRLRNNTYLAPRYVLPPKVLSFAAQHPSIRQEPPDIRFSRCFVQRFKLLPGIPMHWPAVQILRFPDRRNRVVSEYLPFNCFIQNGFQRSDFLCDAIDRYFPSPPRFPGFHDLRVNIVKSHITEDGKQMVFNDLLYPILAIWKFTCAPLEILRHESQERLSLTENLSNPCLLGPFGNVRLSHGPTSGLA